MDESTSEFVTVVEVDEKKNGEDFVTVVHIGQENVGSEVACQPPSPSSPPQTEDVQIFRLPGERLGMALKFEGGACASQPIDRVFIQNINRCSPASRAHGKKIGPLREGDEIIRIQRKPVSGMTRISCVSCLRDEGSLTGARDALVAVTLTVCRTWNSTGSKIMAPLNERNGSTNAGSAHTNGKKGPPPPIPPRLSSTTLSTVPAGRNCEDKKLLASKSTANGLCSDFGKMNGKTGSKKSPPPLPPRRPKDPPPAAPVARKTQPNSRVNNCLQAQSSSAVITEAKTSSRAQNESSPPSGTSDSRLLSSSRVCAGPPVEPHVYTDTLSDRSVCMESESDDTGSSISTIIDRFSRASTASSSISDFSAAHKSPTIDIDDVLQPFEQLERELDQKQALEKYVNETAAMLDESKQSNGMHVNTAASNLDDYDDIESVSMTLSGMENEMPKVGTEKKGNSAKASQGLERLPETECKSSKKTLPLNAKRECNVTKTKDTRLENGEKKNMGNERLNPKPIFRAKSPCLTSKPRHGILKKPKDGLQKGNANSSLQRKIANKSAGTSSSNNLRNSLSQNSRSTSNLNQINSMIPKLDPVKNAPVTPLPRKSRSTSNLLTAVDADSRPSLIPRPVNKTVTFAVNLVKQIQSPSDLMDLEQDPSKILPPDLPKCDPVVNESDDAAQGADQEGGLSEEKGEEVRDEGLRANDPQADDKRDSIPAIVQNNSESQVTSSHDAKSSSSDSFFTVSSCESWLSQTSNQLAPAESEPLTPCESRAEELRSWDTVSEPQAATGVTSPPPPSPPPLAVLTCDESSAGTTDTAITAATVAAASAETLAEDAEQRSTEKRIAEDSGEMSRSRLGESCRLPADSRAECAPHSTPLHARSTETFPDQRLNGLLKKSIHAFHKDFKFLHEDSGIYCNPESPSPEFAKYDASLVIASRQVKQMLQLPSPDNDSGITSDSMDECEVSSSNSSSSRDGCRKYLFKESESEVGEEDESGKLVTDPLPPVRERIAHFQEQVRRSIEALSTTPPVPPVPPFASCFGPSSVSKSLSDVRNPVRFSSNFSSTLNICTSPAKHLASVTGEPSDPSPTSKRLTPGSSYAGHLQPSYRRFTSYDPLVNTSPTVSPLSSLRATTSNDTLSDLLESRRQSTTKLKGLMIPDPSTNSPSSIDTRMPTIVSKSCSTDRLLERAEDMNRSNATLPLRQPATSNKSAVSASLLQSFATIKNTIPKYTPAFKRRGLELSTSGSSGCINSSPIMSPCPSISLLNPIPFTASRSQAVASVRPEMPSPLTRRSGGEQAADKEAGYEEKGDKTGRRIVLSGSKNEESGRAGSDWDAGQGVGGEEKVTALRSSSESCRHFRALAQKWEQRVSEERSSPKFPTHSKSSDNVIRPLTLADDAGLQLSAKSAKDDWSKREENVIKYENYESWSDESLSKHDSQTNPPSNPPYSPPSAPRYASPGPQASSSVTTHDKDTRVNRHEESTPPFPDADDARSKCSLRSPGRSVAESRLHCRFSSVDSTASESGTSTPGPQSVGSRASSFSNLRDSQYGSVTSLASSTSLISAQELQQLIEEANHSLKGEPSHNIQVVVLNRDYRAIGSVGIILAGGVDCETREISVHKIIAGSIADRDGRVRKGDRVLSINGRIIRGLTHKEALDILRAPRSEVVLVLSRPVLDPDATGLRGDSCTDDNDAVSAVNHQAIASTDRTYKTITAVLHKDGAGLGFILEGGKDSPLGDRPLIVKKMFKGGLADKEGSLMPGDEILFVNHESVANMTRTEAWNHLKKLPDGPVQLVVRRVDYGF